MEYEIKLSSERMNLIGHAIRRAAESARVNAIEAFNDPAKSSNEVEKLCKEYLEAREANDWWLQLVIDTHRGGC